MHVRILALDGFGGSYHLLHKGIAESFGKAHANGTCQYDVQIDVAERIV